VWCKKLQVVGFWFKNEGGGVMTCNMVRFEGVQEIAGRGSERCIGLQVKVIDEHHHSPHCFVDESIGRDYTLTDCEYQGAVRDAASVFGAVSRDWCPPPLRI